MRDPNVDDVRAALKERIVDVIEVLYPGAEREGTFYQVSNIRREPTKENNTNTYNLSIEVIDPRKKGTWIDSSTEEKGTIIDLIMASQKLDFPKALRWACNFLKMPFLFRPLSVPRTREGVEHDTANPQALKANKKRLKQHPEAMAYLTGEKRGLTPQTIEHFHLGLYSYTDKQTGQVKFKDALNYPQLDSVGQPRSRFLRSSIPDVTVTPDNRKDWAAGEPSTYWVTPDGGRQHLLICKGPQDGWRIWQALQGDTLLGQLCIITSTHSNAIPKEWQSQAFWASWDNLYVAQDDEESEKMILGVRKYALRDVQRVRVPDRRGNDWTEFFNSGGTVLEFHALLQGAPIALEQLSTAVMTSVLPEEDGTFQVQPVDLSRAFIRGHLYYPFRSGERRTVDGRRLIRWRDQVLRSDGTICAAYYLPCEPGTPFKDRMLALNDGTILTRMPAADPLLSTFTTDAIMRFAAARRAGRSALTITPAEMLALIDQHLRSKIILPYDHDFAMLTFAVITSYVQAVFEAVPLVLVVGMAGSGKSELGAAIADVSCNAIILNGQTSAASVARAIDSAGGLAVIDDLEGIGSVTKNAHDYSELVQQLKVSYKKATAKKKWTNTKTMQLEELNFFGLKVVNNTEGADPILGSRMLKVYTKKISKQHLGDYIRPPELSPEQLVDLRNNLHVWAMESACDVDVLYQQRYKQHDERQAEITAPLRLLAEFIGEPVFAQRLNEALQMQENTPEKIESGVELLSMALRELIRQGYQDAIAMPHLEYEMLRITGSSTWGMTSTTQNPEWQEPRWIGKQLRLMMAIDSRAEGHGRTRLWGQQIRTYPLDPEFVATTITDLHAEGAPVVTERLEALTYCTHVECSVCPYTVHCCFQEKKTAQLKKYRPQSARLN